MEKLLEHSELTDLEGGLPAPRRPTWAPRDERLESFPVGLGFYNANRALTVTGKPIPLA